MKAAPAVTVVVERFDMGTCFAAFQIAACATVAAVWVGSMWSARPVGWLIALAALGAVTFAAGALAIRRLRPLVLRWDGQTWHWHEHELAASPGARAAQGHLDVMIDLKVWMMLRLRSRDARAARWLPVQRQGLQSQWHALRCAVYSPRPVP